MVPTYSFTLKLGAEHVDFRRKYRLSSMMRLFQKCCIAHTEELGMGRAKTLDKGLLWVVLSERFLISRYPEYDEEVTVVCHPGTTLHYFFPRHLELLSSNGECLVQAASLWALIDQRTREFADPSEHGIVILGGEKGNEIMTPTRLGLGNLPNQKEILSEYSLVDINGHLNNASYLDLAMDLIPLEELKRKQAVDATLCFKKETPLGESFVLSYGQEGDAYLFSSPKFDAKIVFAE